MKKQYVKPELYFENFELSMNIATGCEATTNHAKDECAYNVAGKYVFVDNVNACTTKTPGGNYNGLCYHNPTDDNNLFTS